VRRGRSWSRFRSRSEWNTSEGEWLLEKHGTKTRRSWRKLHIGLDAGSGQIVAASLTAKEVDDGAEVGPLLDQITGVVASFTGDGGYDQDCVYASVAERHPEAAVVNPPRATAVPSETAETAPTQRDRHLQHVEPRGSPDIAGHGRMAWQRASGYTTRARAEAAIGRFKQVIGNAGVVQSLPFLGYTRHAGTAGL